MKIIEKVVHMMSAKQKKLPTGMPRLASSKQWQGTVPCACLRCGQGVEEGFRCRDRFGFRSYTNINILVFC